LASAEQSADRPGTTAPRAGEPEHLEKLYVRMMKNGSAPATAHQAHRTIRTALNEAVRRGHLVRNPAMLAKAPRLPEAEVEPYSVDEIRLLLKSALERRNGARWAVALALGLRQGEALGLRWDDVDLDAGTLFVRRGRLRPRWEHGCGGTCGRRFGGHCPNRVALRDERQRPSPALVDAASASRISSSSCFACIARNRIGSVP
jgi:integrase